MKVASPFALAAGAALLAGLSAALTQGEAAPRPDVRLSEAAG